MSKRKNQEAGSVLELSRLLYHLFGVYKDLLSRPLEDILNIDPEYNNRTYYQERSSRRLLCGSKQGRLR